MSIERVLDDGWPDEQDQFGSRPRLILMRGRFAHTGNGIEERNTLPLLALCLADQAGEQHGLAANDRNRTFHPPLRYRRRQRSRCGSSRHIADLLFDVEHDVAVSIGARQHAQNNAGIFVVDGVYHCVASGQNGRTSGRERHLIADLQRCRLVIEHHQRWVGKYLYVGDAVQRVENDARRILGSDQEIEAGKRAIQKSAGGGVNGTARRTDGIGSGGTGRDGIDDRTLLACYKKLHAIIQRVVQRDLGNCRLDCYLALWSVDLADSLLDDALRFLIGIDQHSVVDDIGGDPDILKRASTG